MDYDQAIQFLEEFVLILRRDDLVQYIGTLSYTASIHRLPVRNLD